MPYCARCLNPASVIHTSDGRATTACPAHTKQLHDWCARAGPVTTTHLNTSDSDNDQQQPDQPALF